ncbi:hypothetical protein PHMEG_0008802, partial [Phytophthora megakarya]
VAIIQTLLIKSSFESQNVIAVWSDARISKVHLELIQLVCDDLQRLLSVELLEWRQLISEATRRFLSAEEIDVLMTIPDGQTSKSAVVVDGHPGDQDGDAVMTTEEAQQLGHAFARQVTAAGIRRSRSPQSSVGEPELKLPQHQPPRPNMASISSASTLQSYPSSNATSRGVKREAPSTSSMRSSSGFSSGIFQATGGSDESLPNATSGSPVSRDRSSGSSGLSFGIGAGTHMPFAGVMPRMRPLKKPVEPFQLKVTFRRISLRKVTDTYLWRLTNTMWRFRIPNHKGIQGGIQ